MDSAPFQLGLDRLQRVGGIDIGQRGGAGHLRHLGACAVDLLDDTQKKTWKELLGEPFDLMKMADPDKKARKPLNDGALAFPFFTIENVDIVDGSHIIVGNDNNLPFSSSRDPNKADDNEFVLLRVEDFLKAK